MTHFLDLALINGNVRTLDRQRPFAHAIGVADGRIAVVDEITEVMSMRDPRTTVIDLRGATVVPGITDSHLHPFQGALRARGADLTKARTLDEVRTLVAAERARCAPEAWVLGFGLDYNVFNEHGIRGELLADAAGGGPALLTFEDLHTELATPRALELAGVTGAQQFEEHAEVVTDPHGRPTGELRERSAIMLVRRAMPQLTAAERYRLCAEQLKRFAEVGITGAHGMDGDLVTLELLRELEANDQLPIRLVMPYSSNPDTPDEILHEFADHRAEAGSRWRTGVAKLFADGVIDSGTGWLLEADTQGDGLIPFWPDLDRFRSVVRLFASRGFQVAVHATGDRAVRETLNALRAAGTGAGIRHRIEHIETLHATDLPRFANEGVVASMQAQHMIDLAPDRSDNYSRRLGRKRCERLFPIRSLTESGALVVLGSDWPVASYDWREGMAAAQLRRPPGDRGRPAYDSEGIDALSALRGYTSNAAAAVGDDHQLGSIRPGYLADLTVLADDPLNVPADDLVTTQIMLTVVGGQIQHRSGDLDA